MSVLLFCFFVSFATRAHACVFSQLTVHQVKHLLTRLDIRRCTCHSTQDLLQWVHEVRQTEARSTGRDYMIGAAMRDAMKNDEPHPSIRRIREACYLEGPSVEPKPRIHRMVFVTKGANHVICVGESVVSCFLTCRSSACLF